MTLLTLLGIAVVALAVGIVLFRSIPALSAYFTLRGKRLITCPETHATTIEWNRFRPEQLSEVFPPTNLSVGSHIAHTFRQVHPELVTDQHREVHLIR